MRTSFKKRREISIVLILVLIFGIFPSNIMERAEVKAAESDYGISNPHMDSDGVTTWDCVYFGNYWQNDTNGDGVADQNDEKEPIKWRVLSVDGDDAFLMTDQILDWQQWNDKQGEFPVVTWKDTTLRAWLNQSFYQEAFTENEKLAVKETTITNEGDSKNEYLIPDGEDSVDKVYLLSKTEAGNSNYGLPDEFLGDMKRTAECTEYAKALRPSDISWGLNSWWLRTGGYFVDGAGTESVGIIGSEEYITIKDYRGIRPVIHIDCSMDLWTKAPSVSMDQGIKRKFQYTIHGIEGTLFFMNNRESWVEIGDYYIRLWNGVDIAGFDRDGRFWHIDEDNDLRLTGTYTWGEEMSDVLMASPVLTVKDLQYDAWENLVKDLVFDDQGYVIGYQTLSGEIHSLPATYKDEYGRWDFLEEDETTNATQPTPTPNAPSNNNNPVINTPGINVNNNTNSVSNISPQTKTVSKVKNLQGKNLKGRKVRLSFKKSQKVKGYQIAYATNKKFKNQKTKSTTKTSLTIKNLQKKTYYFRVRAYTLNGKKKLYGKWSKVKKVKIKK